MTEFERATVRLAYKRALNDIAGMNRLADLMRAAGKNGLAGNVRDAAEDALAFVAWNYGRKADEVVADLIRIEEGQGA